MCYKTLPEGYTFHDKIDLRKNKKQFWTVQGICLAIVVAMFGIGWLIESPLNVAQFIHTDGNFTKTLIAVIVLIVGYVAYIFAHEAVHGLFMYAFCKTKINYGFVGWAAYAGSSAYYDKKRYVIIALAPVVVWGVVFAVLNIFFHSGLWFWVIWILQIGNVSGACGDFFCTFKMATYPKDILVNDTGMEMQVFRKLSADETAETVDAEEETESESNVTAETNGEEN